MDIGEQRRTWHVEPIEELPDDPVREPDPEQQPTHEPVLVPEPESGR